MSKGVLEFLGMKEVEYQGNFETKAMFAKKGGGSWGLGKGNVDWSQFQPHQKLYVEWENWVALSATTNIPAGGKGGYKPQPYHPEQFVSNIVGQSVAVGACKTPSELPEWTKMAALSIIAAQKLLHGGGAQEAPQQKPQHDDFEDKEIPF